MVAELRKGYFLGDRLLRPAMVEVAVPSEASAGSSPANATGSDGSDGSNDADRSDGAEGKLS